MNEYDELIDNIFEWWQVGGKGFSPIEQFGNVYLISTKDALLVYCIEVRDFVAKIDIDGTVYILRSSHNLDVDDFLSELEDNARDGDSIVKVVRKITL